MKGYMVDVRQAFILTESEKVRAKRQGITREEAERLAREGYDF